MIDKRGQVTIFIVVAIVIVAAIGLYFTFRGNLGPEGPVPSHIEPIYLFVQECIEETGQDALSWISQHGGYFIVPELSTESGIPYYYYGGKSYMPSKEKENLEISKYMSNSLELCINDFSTFPEFIIERGEIRTKTRIGEDKVIFDVKYPLFIRTEEGTSVVENFDNIEIRTRFGVIYNSIEKIINDQLGRDEICVSCILDIMLEDDLFIDLIDVDDGVIFSVHGDQNEFPLEWLFANKYA